MPKKKFQMSPRERKGYHLTETYLGADLWRAEDDLTEKFTSFGLPATDLYFDKTKRGIKGKIRLKFLGEIPSDWEISSISENIIGSSVSIINQGRGHYGPYHVIDVVWYEEEAPLRELYEMWGWSKTLGGSRMRRIMDKARQDFEEDLEEEDD